MLDIEKILAAPLAETFTVGGVAPNVLAAHNMAWDGLTASLGGDPIAAWTLKAMQHAMSTNPRGVAFTAEFARNPHYENEAS